MEKNPFSIYDFMGYLFPGALTMFFICYVSCGSFDPYNIFNLELLAKAFTLDLNVDNCMIGRLVMFVIISYVLGHIVSYLSSLTVEVLFRNMFGYPSGYLLGDSRIKKGTMWKNYFSHMETIEKLSMRIAVRIVKAILLFILFPISVMNFTLGHFFGINAFVTRPLDNNLKHIINNKTQSLLKQLEANVDTNSTPKWDSHRMILHYVYHNISSSQRKTDNYIALYGFLRCISFIFCIAFDALFVYALTTINFSAQISWKLVAEVIILFFVAYVSYLGFTKFYRKYTLENYMALVTEISPKTSHENLNSKNN